MKIPLTLSNLLHQRWRTLIAVSGVGFSILLVFMQLGFFGSAEATATVFFKKLDFDLILLSKDYIDINRSGSFPRSRLAQCQAVPGVVRVSPMWITGNLWRIVNPRNKEQNGRRRGIMVVGFELGDPVFRLEGLEGELDLLKIPGNVLIDTLTRNYFGDRGFGVDKRFDHQVESDLGLGRATIVGTFTVGAGYGWDGMLLMSAATFSRILGGYPLERINLGLIKLEKGKDWATGSALLRKRQEVAAALQSYLPADEVRVLTRKEMMDQETDFWINRTSLGKIFFIGVIVALVVGTVFVYQVLSSDITSRFPEYATLKAVGYGDGYLSQLVLQQALAYALLGYVPGFLLSLVLYEVAGTLAALPITMTWGRALGVFVLTVAMCSLSGLLAIRKVKTADPADLF